MTSQAKSKPKETAVTRLVKAYASSQAQLEQARNGLISTARNRQRSFATGYYPQAEVHDARFVKQLAEEKRLRAIRVRDWRSHRLVADPPPKKPSPELESERAYRSIQRSCLRTRTWLLMLIRARWGKQPQSAPGPYDRPWEPHELTASLITRTHFASGLLREKPLTDEEYEADQKRFSKPKGGAMVRRLLEAPSRLAAVTSAEMKALEPLIDGYLLKLSAFEQGRQAAFNDFRRERAQLKKASKPKTSRKGYLRRT